MASPRIGSDDALLLVVETPYCTVSLKGRPVHPLAAELGVVPKDISKHYLATLEVAGNYMHAMCYDPQAAGDLREYVPGSQQFACFYEQTPYQLVIENKGEKELSFYHMNPALRNAVGTVGTKGKVLSGVLNFRNEVGLSTFEVRSNGTTLLAVTLEVFPSKLEYREDYFRLVNEVNTEIYNLAFDFLRRTYLKAKLNERQQASLAEFYSIISYVFDRLTVAFGRVKTSPHQRIVTAHDVVRVEKVRRTDNASRKWLTRNAALLKPCESGLQVADQHYLPERMLDARKRVSYDTYENRVLKWMLTRILDRLGELKRRYEGGQRQQQDTEVLGHLSRMMRGVRAMLNEDFLRETGHLTRLDGQSLVLQMAPGYREVYRYYLMLSKGLSIQGSIFELSMKDVAQLYEYWCFLALGSILRKKYDLHRQEAIAVRGDGLAVVLDTTRKADLHFTNRQTGERYILSYNPRSDTSPTVNQRPDNILTLHKDGSDVKYRYIFDAKYRIDPAQEGTPYHRNYGSAGPQEEDINTMHRYRDALVYQQADGGYKRGAFGAVILFPYSEESRYAGEDGQAPHRFFQSIEQVGVGGLPFLPGHTRLVEDMLDKLIVASPDTAQEQAGETVDTERYYRERFEQRNVLVGVVRSKQHLDVHLKHRFYHIPLSRLPKGFSHLEYIALYEPISVSPETPGVQHWAKIRSACITPRSSITEIPGNKRDPYVRFELGPWQETPRIVPAGYGVRSCIYTTQYLLQRARRLPELSLRSDNDLRLWKELQRLDNNISVLAAKKELDPDTGVAEFKIGCLVIRIVGGVLHIGHGVKLSVQDLKYRPMYVLNVIRRELEEVRRGSSTV